MARSQGLAVACLTLACLLAPCAHGQDDDETADARLKASLGSVVYFSDNFYNQSAGSESGYGTLLRPEFSYLKRTSRLDLAGAFDGEYGAFSLPGSDDDYVDGGAQLRLASQASLRNHVRFEAAFRRGHDAFGVNRTEDATARGTDLDQWNQVSGSMHYRYGSPGARLNAQVGAGRLEKRYVTNRAVTEPLNYDSTTVDYTLFYNYGPKTAALLDFVRSDFEFDRAFGATDSRGGELYRIRAGVKWLASGKTAGDVRAGYRRRTFDAGTPDFEGVDWEAGVDWSPVPRSTLRLQTARSEQESYVATARLIDVQSVALRWHYSVSSRARASLALEHLAADFDGSGREDEIVSTALGAQVLVRSFIWMVGHVGFNTRDSTVANREYDRLDAYLGIRLGR
jgi:polysaccharide biosynthesis protein VpsM